MSAKRSRRIDRRTAEQLLRGGPDGAGDVGPDVVSDLLAAASGPARDSELAGEQAAVAAFRTARLRPVPQPRRQPMFRPTLAKLTTVKAGVAAAAVIVAIGGVAVATAGDEIPTDGGGRPSDLPTAAASPTPGDQGNVPSDVPNGPKDTGKPAPGDNGKNENNPSPAPSLEGLCHAYTAGEDPDRGKRLDNPAFSYLILTAGGEDKVDGYCADLLQAKPGKPEPPAGKPTNPGRPGEPHPGDKPKNTQPTVRPTP